MSSTQFKTDLKRGQVAENLLFEVLKTWDLEPQLAEGYHPDFDIKLNTGITIEIKYDILAETTGNLALELEALNHSKAGILAIAYGKPIKAFYLIEMNRAREFAKGWCNKKRVGEFRDEAALIKRTLFIELLKPEIIELKNPKSQAFQT